MTDREQIRKDSQDGARRAREFERGLRKETGRDSYGRKSNREVGERRDKQDRKK